MIFTDKFDQFGVGTLDENGELYSIRSGGVCDPRGKICPLCGKGWEFNAKDVLNQFYHHEQHRLMHNTCFVHKLEFDDFSLLHDALSCSVWDVDMNTDRIPFHIKPITNEYGGEFATNWYKVSLPDMDGELKFGRRKRVYSITFVPNNPFSEKVSKEITKQFSNEDVTKEFRDDYFMIHAWTEQKVKEYIIKLSFIIKGVYDQHLISSSPFGTYWFDKMVEDETLRKMAIAMRIINDIKMKLELSDLDPDIIKQVEDILDKKGY